MMSEKNTKLNGLAWFVVNLPLINIISAFSVQLIGRDSFHLGIVRGLIHFIIIAIVLWRRGIHEKITIRIIVFVIYLFILILFSSDFMYSLTGTYLKILASMMLFPVGYYMVNDFHKLTLLLKNIVLGGLLLCINYLFAQIFSIGRSVYLDDSFYYGYAGIGSTVILCYLLLVSPLLRKQFNTRIGSLIFRIVVFLSFLFTIIALKRIAIIALIIGYMIYFLSSTKKLKNIRSVIVIAAFLVITAPMYTQVFTERLEARTTEENQLNQEQRYFDIVIALQAVKNNGLRHAILGSEAFNSPGYFGRDRQVHVDYANLLIGTGILGLIMYLGIYLNIAVKFRKLYQTIRNINSFYHHFEQNRLKDLKGVFFAIFFASLIVSFSGGLHVISTRSIVFLVLGSILGTLSNIEKYYKFLTFKRSPNYLNKL